MSTFIWICFWVLNRFIYIYRDRKNCNAGRLKNPSYLKYSLVVFFNMFQNMRSKYKIVLCIFKWKVSQINFVIYEKHC